VNRDGVVEALQSVFQRSPYFDYLFRNARQFGVKTGREGMIVNLDYGTGGIGFEYVAEAAKAAPPLWIGLRERDLLKSAAEGGAVAGLRVETTPSTPPPDPALERLLLHVFGNGAAPPVSEREDLIYHALFGGSDPHLVWQSEELPVRVLVYEGAFDDKYAFVTSGFSNPELGPPAGKRDDLLLVGFGYELILLSDKPGGPLARQFVDWTDYVCRTKEHILRLNWLEYQEPRIPNTTLSGFIVVPPLTIPEHFPVNGGSAVWNLLLGVTAEELAVAKKDGALAVAKKLADAGFVDWTPAERPSTV
jgi:hypothetical protein